MIRLARIPDTSLLLSASLLFVALTSSHAQSRGAAAEFSFAPLRQGSLTIWIVYPNPKPGAPIASAPAAPTGPPQYREQTAGSFGQDAGTYGQTAGSTGQTAGSFGTPAGSVGTPASNTGQTAGSYGRAASTVGTNAGDAGQSVGSFGTSTSDLARTAAAANDATLPLDRPHRTNEWENFLQRLRSSFPQLQLHVEDLYDTDLQAQLEATATTPNRPDVLLGDPLPSIWANPSAEDLLRLRRSTLRPARPGSGIKLVDRFGVSTLGREIRLPQTENDTTDAARHEPQTAILANPPHGSDAARAFYVWVSDGGVHGARNPAGPQEAAASELAVRTLQAALHGSPLGPDADPRMAGYESGSFGKGSSGAAISSDILVQIDVTAIHLRANSAIVALRAVLSSQRAFGVVHALVVVRKDEAGKWKALQLSPTLTASMQTQGFTLWTRATSGHADSNPLDGATARPLGIGQASPPDGDNRSAQPELWWDNLGGASMQVVEWALPGSTSNLFFVPDSDATLRTRVIARFATGGSYRWRVWSVGAEGEIVLSPWRTFSVVAR